MTILEFSPGGIEYRRLKEGGIEILRTFWCRSSLLKGYARKPHVAIPGGRVELIDDGETALRITHAGYRLDGASVPTAVRWLMDPDDPEWIKAAAGHDSGYHLSREGLVTPWRDYKRAEDIVFRETLIMNGLARWKYQAAYHGVVIGGASSARPQRDIESKVLHAP